MPGILLLLSVPGVPLLLAIPALRRRLPWPCHLALLPALMLVAAPAVISIELPWLLFGAGFSFDGASRWLLAMSVAVWAVAVTLLHANTHQPRDNQLTTFVLLTMAGNLGVILAADLVGFFVFSTLMGYAFYGLLVAAGGQTARRAGRVYLVCLILADLVLFDALLLAAATTEHLGFTAVHQAMARSPSSVVYLAMVLVGFALKAGVWPLHFWLPPAFHSARPAVALLLLIGPVATGLLGAVHWLPLGEITAPELGTSLQYLGVAAMLYAVLSGVMRAQWKWVPAYATVVATGAFITGLGTGLAEPAVWSQHGDSALILLASMGLGLVLITAGTLWLEARWFYPSGPEEVGRALPWFERWPQAMVRWGRRAGNHSLPGLRDLLLARVSDFWRTRAWKNAFDAGEHFMRHWAFAVTLLLLLGMLFAVLSLLDAMKAA